MRIETVQRARWNFKSIRSTSFSWNPKYFLKFLFNMTSKQETQPDKSLLLPPSCVSGMKILDKEKFSKTISVPFLTSPLESLPQLLKSVKKYLLKMSNLNPVQSVDGTSLKRILLDPLKIHEGLKFTDQKKGECLGFKEDDLKICEVTLTYDNWLAEPILKAVLPSDQEGVASWSIIGHIIHVNLRDHLLEFKYLIGQVLLDKNKQARSVVNKANMIDSTYRTFQIELLAGEDNMLTQVRENHCSYEFDFSKVYWNPRLVGEHERLVDDLHSGDILYDVFAGVGPFAIPAAKKRCRVLANDLNPESFKWLQHNIKMNKVAERVTAFNKDGADFICNDLKNDLSQQWAAGDLQEAHITMNLPAMAVEFLKNFKGLYSHKERPSNFKAPIVHVYCFIKNAEDSSTAAKELVEQHLGATLGDNLRKVSLVRTVSNNKHMMRVSFTLSENVMIQSKGDEDEPPSKKLCLQDLKERST